MNPSLDRMEREREGERTSFEGRGTTTAVFGFPFPVLFPPFASSWLKIRASTAAIRAANQEGERTKVRERDDQ